MGYLIRKITRGKWSVEDVGAPISADAITSCLRTSRNTLSVWYAEREEDIENAKIALLGTLQQVAAVDIVILNTEDIDAQGLVLSKTEGDTVATSLRTSHRDIIEISINELLKVAEIVKNTIISGKYERINVRKFKELLETAVASDLIKAEDLSVKMGGTKPAHCAACGK